MGRHGYSDYCDDDLAMGRWRAQVNNSIRGKRGQAFLKELIAALEAMPKKELIAEELIEPISGQVCALGAVGLAKGINIETIDPEDHETLSQKFNITHQLVQEIEYENDEGGSRTPEERWKNMLAWAKLQLVVADPPPPTASEDK